LPAGRVLLVHLGHGEHRVEARRRQVPDAGHRPVEGALAADGVVRGRVEAVERDPQVERVVGGRGERREAAAAGGVEEQAVGQHVAGPTARVAARIASISGFRNGSPPVK
jgi:hypothetical protein